MELEYILKAVRRFLPVVVLSVVIGVIAGQYLQGDSIPRYESTALTHIRPPDEGGTAEDRYVASQLVVLESPPVAARAAEIAGVGAFEPGAVAFLQIAGTDIVRIIGSSFAPEAAQTAANAYLDAYVERVGVESAADDTPTADELDQTRAEIESQINDVAARLEEALAPYVERAESDAQIPTAEQIAPALAAEREVLLGQYQGVLAQRATLEFEPPAPRPSMVIQRADVPTAPVSEAASLMAFAVPIVVIAFGVAVATLLARSSRRVLDVEEASELLGLPFAGSLPRARALRAGALGRLAKLPDEFARSINELCVQVEVHGRLDEPLTVLVTGSQRIAGTTTVAAAMAARFGQLGSRVVLVDLDFDRPELADFFGVEGDGFAALVRGGATAESALKMTNLPNVTVVGRGGEPGARPQRAELVMALDRVSHLADVVVFDAGPVLGASVATVLAQHANAVVLTVPVWTQERSSLEVVGRQLQPVKKSVLPVSMPRLREGRSESTDRPAPSSGIDADVVVSSAL